MRLSVVIIGSLAAACGTDADVDATLREQGASPDTPHARSLESLAALGYAAWDAPSTEEHPPATTLEPERVQPWPRAWANDRNLVHVIDAGGAALRTITVPGRTQVEFARFLTGGRIACVSVDEGLTLLEADGSVVWHFDAACHHDVAVVPDGSSPGDRTFALAVHGAREWRGRQVRFDDVIFVDERTGGPAATLSTWSTAAHREALMQRADGPHPLDRAADGSSDGAIAATTYDYFHLNSIAFDGPQTMVLCLRNVDLIVRVDLGTGALGRSLGPGTLDWPHAPSIVERDGTAAILVFDNGTHRGWSRAVELDPTSGEVLWEFRGSEAAPLFSAVRGFAQRLPNGNTLITESERGHALEVTADGEVIWEFWNSETRETPDGRARRRIYRMTAVPPAAFSDADGGEGMGDLGR